MNERLKAHVEQLFLGSPHTRQAADVKEELLANLQAKYEDMLNQGKNEDDAFESVIAGIGDICSLLGEKPQYNTRVVYEKRKSSGVLKAVAIGLLVLAIIPTIVLSAIFTGTWLEWIIPIPLVSMTSIAVVLFIIGSTIGPKKYVKGDDTFVEAYKEKVSGNSRDARLQRAVSSTLWTIVLIVYLLVSFISGAWHVTWLIWIIGAMMQNVIKYLLDSDKAGSYKNLLNNTIWLVTLMLYFLISFTTGAWGITWIIFIIAVLIQQLVKLIDVWREDE
jgi:hypothetical protein